MANSVDDMVAGAKKTLADANAFTASVEGTPTSHFAPQASPSHIDGIKAAPHEHDSAPYQLGRELRAKQTNVDEYKSAPK
jgi:hypothetical protein